MRNDQTKKQKLSSKNIEKLSTKYNCECGGKYTYESKNKHLSTKKHIKWQKEQELEEVVDV